MKVGQLDAVADVREEGSASRSGLGARGSGLGLRQGHALVRRDVIQDRHAPFPIRPLYSHGLERVARPDTEGEHVVHARLEPARRLLFLEELLCPAPQRDLRADGEPIGARALEPHLQVMVRGERPGVVAIDERLLVDVVHDQIDRAVAVQVAIGSAARKTRRVEAPGRALVREGRVAPVAKRVVRQLGRAHRVDEPLEIHPRAARRLDHGFPAPQKCDVVLGRDVLGEPVRHVDVLVAVEIEIRDERAPAPVGSRHTRHLADVRERAVPVVQMEHVARELVMKVVAHLFLEPVPVLERSGGLEPALVVRQHVRHIDVGPAVVVHVRDVQSHRRQTDIRHLLLEPLGEGAVALIDVEIVALEEVVGDVDVGPAVAVQVAHADPETQTDLAPVDAGGGAHVHEMPAVVAIQPIAAERVADGARVFQIEARNRAGRVVDHEQVEITVAVVVEEHGLRGVAGIGHAVRRGLFYEGGNAVGVEPLIDVQLVGPELRVEAGVADVDVEQSVAIHVGQRDAGGPAPAVQPGLGRDVPEPEFPFVQIQSGATEIRCEHDLGQPVPGEVAQGDAAAVVVIAIGEDVQVVRVRETILEAHAGVARWQEREQMAVGGRRGRGGGRRATGQQAERGRKKM